MCVFVFVFTTPLSTDEDQARSNNSVYTTNPIEIRLELNAAITAMAVQLGTALL